MELIRNIKSGPGMPMDVFYPRVCSACGGMVCGEFSGLCWDCAGTVLPRWMSFKLPCAGVAAFPFRAGLTTAFCVTSVLTTHHLFAGPGPRHVTMDRCEWR